MSDQKVALTINDKKVEVAPGTTVFNAAVEAGVFIPHYCYHPDLSIAGVCRMCMVDIEKNPRLQISCNTVATEGMVVKTDTDKVKSTVKDILELHLINHPIDCPICDKAGECKLQDFYSAFGLYESRMEYDKVHKPKVQDIGPIMLDSERCILCSRCVRFTAEVTKTNELGIFNRGDRSVLRTYDEGPLKNEYTGNLADICPVGALTAKDFRFQQRVWFLDNSATVCTLCAAGCNTKVSKNPGTQKLYRVEPRRNPEVNKSWICDRGRWEFHFVHDDNRLKSPLYQAGSVSSETTWHAVFQSLHTEITADPSKVLIALSTQSTNEEVADAVATFKGLGVTDFTWIVDEAVVADKKPYDGLLKQRDLTSNAFGFETVMRTLGQPWLKQADAIQKVKSSQYHVVLCLGLEGYEMPGLAPLLLAVSGSTIVALHATTRVALFEKATYLLPAASSFEKSGTIMNSFGRLQKLQAAVPKQFLSRDVHQVAWGLAQNGDRNPTPALRFNEVFKQVVAEKIQKEPLDWRKFNPMGLGAPK